MYAKPIKQMIKKFPQSDNLSQVRLPVVLRLPDRVDRVRQDRRGGVGAAVRRGAGHAALLRPLRVPGQEQQGRSPLERGHHRRGQGKCINHIFTSGS